MNNIKKVFSRLTKIIIVSSLFIVAFAFLYFYLWFKVGINDLKRQHNKNIEIELENRDDNIKIFNEYINDVYGILSDTFKIEIKPDVVSTDTDFDINTEFMDKPFRVIVDTDNKNIYSDNFYKVLSKDPKFQHLYSEWVKKQVGIEDEDVELELAYGEIDFKSIKSLNKTNDEIFENCKYSLERVNIKNVKEEDRYIVFNDFRKKYYDKLKKDNNNSFVVNFNNDYEDVIGIGDYVKIGKKDYHLKRVGIGQERSIEILCKEEQLDIFFSDIDNINRLLREAIPVEIEADNKIIKVLNGKIYKGSVLRVDLSDISKKQYIIDVLYYDEPSEYYYNGGEPILHMPKYMRYSVILKDNKFNMIGHNEICRSEYLGDKYIKKLYERNTKVDKVTVYNANELINEDIEFYSIEMVGQPDDDKVNEVISKEFKNITKEYIEKNISVPLRINSKIHRKFLFDILLQSDDYVVFSCMLLDNYLVLDLKEYRFVDNKVIARDDNYTLIEVDGRIFMMCNEKYENEFIDYTIISNDINETVIKFYRRYSDYWYVYKINSQESKLEMLEKY